jgi:S1-C subfamily serine protease
LNADPNSRITVSSQQGVLIGQVMPGSPAERSGLRAGDVILSINGTAIATADEVQAQVEQTKVGSSLSMEIERNGRTQKLNVTTGAFPTDPAQKR